MIEGLSSSPSDSVASRQSQMGTLILKQSADSERQIADLMVRQVQAPGSAAQSSSNPPHLGGNVDTYA